MHSIAIPQLIALSLSFRRRAELQAAIAALHHQLVALQHGAPTTGAGTSPDLRLYTCPESRRSLRLPGFVSC